MGIFDLFRRKPETRAAAGYTADIIAAREAYISGRRGIAELTATAATCTSLWEAGLSMADVDGAPLLDRETLGMAGRALALRGEALFLIRPDRLVPASDWDVTTRDARPRAYRISIPESAGGHSITALAGEVLHLRIGGDPAAPWYGSSPLRRAQLSAELLQAVETGLRDVYENAPLGSQTVPLPATTSNSVLDGLRSAFAGGPKGKTFVWTTQNMGHTPDQGAYRPTQLSPDLEKTLMVEALAASRNAIAAAFGVIPAFFNPNATGPVFREAHRALAQWQLQPIANLIAEEAGRKLGADVTLDVMRPLQAFDTGGRARALSAVLQATAQAKAEGLSPEEIAEAFRLVDWNQEGDTENGS